MEEGFWSMGGARNFAAWGQSQGQNRAYVLFIGHLATWRPVGPAGGRAEGTGGAAAPHLREKYYSKL